MLVRVIKAITDRPQKIRRQPLVPATRQTDDPIEFPRSPIELDHRILVPVLYDNRVIRHMI